MVDIRFQLRQGETLWPLMPHPDDLDFESLDDDHPWSVLAIYACARIPVASVIPCEGDYTMSFPDKHQDVYIANYVMIDTLVHHLSRLYNKGEYGLACCVRAMVEVTPQVSQVFG